MSAASVTDLAEMVRRMMDELRLKGSYDVRCGCDRAVGWVGEPGDDDVAVTLNIALLPPLDTSAEEMFRRQNPGL